MTDVIEYSAGVLNAAQMQQHLARFPGYRAPATSPAQAFAAETRALWGGQLTPMMCHPATAGRFAGGALSCPPTACTGSIELEAGAASLPWRNPDAIENLVCVEGAITVDYGPALEGSVTLGRFDMLSLPKGVRHRLRNTGGAAARLVSVLSIEPAGSYDAVFATAERPALGTGAQTALGLRFDDAVGEAVEEAVIQGRITRFAQLVPYKKDLNRTAGLPAEATMALSAGSVFPLIVPEGHVGRSQTAPMYGHQGLYMSIAECTAGDDGPPPHSHSDTQESFFVLNGRFDICTGFDNESVVEVQPGDLFATPNKLMRTFRNTDSEPSRLLVIIQGPDRMQDTVSFSKRIGDDFSRRFGADIIDKYAAIRMTFDAEERLGA